MGTVLPAISCAATERTVFDGIAKPTPSLPPESLWICALTPITWAEAFSSGPPELPWLIGASVWIELAIVKLFGAGIERCRALTMPLVTVPGRPNGLPIATTGSPTCTRVRVAEPEWASSEEGAETRTTARSVELSLPTSRPLTTCRPGR